jgi:dihydropteroate synthase
MGVLNITPDSFSDGGQAVTLDQAVTRTAKLLEEGADVIDIGAESTRPQASPIDVQTERARLLPILKILRQKFPKTPFSIDTYKAETAEAALTEGADMINDIEGGNYAQNSDHLAMAKVCAKARCPLIIMHRRPEANYENFWTEILADLRTSIHQVLEAGVAPTQLWTDPGFGFGKTPAQNLMLVRNLEKIVSLGYPVLLGTSRKSTLGLVLNQTDPLQRHEGNIATAIWGVAQGCSMVRVHDVAPLVKYLKVADALRRGPHWKA